MDEDEEDKPEVEEEDEDESQYAGKNKEFHFSRIDQGKNFGFHFRVPDDEVFFFAALCLLLLYSLTHTSLCVPQIVEFETYYDFDPEDEFAESSH